MRALTLVSHSSWHIDVPRAAFIASAHNNMHQHLFQCSFVFCMINMWNITNKNKNIPLTNEELESILQDEQFYDLFDDENNGSVIDSDHETINSHDSNSVTEVTNNDDISDRNDEENSDDAFLGIDKTTKWMKLPPPT
ncbi:hypothetical protein FQA39_LY01520 [Lamprigera yunnana]|nr:hypothetical protein FQA39_LY01520 [Lamprigera yunnana]